MPAPSLSISIAVEVLLLHIEGTPEAAYSRSFKESLYFSNENLFSYQPSPIYELLIISRFFSYGTSPCIIRLSFIFGFIIVVDSLIFPTILKKRFPRIVLNIVGKISESTTIINENIKDNLIMDGLVPYEKNLEIISNSYIGLGWYENKFSFEKYNDSLKLREYAASGVPSICNNKTSTAIEMDKEGAGIIANTEKELAGAIATFITNEEKYYDMHINSIRWAKENDKSKLLEKLLRTLGL